MEHPKRPSSPAESDSDRCTKMAKLTQSAQPSDNPVVAGVLAQSRIDDVHVTVKIRSTSKAALNDPMPDDYWTKYFSTTLSDGSAGDGSSTTSGHNRATSCPAQAPSPTQPSSSTATGTQVPSVPSASVEDPRPDGHGPIAGSVENGNSAHSIAHSEEGGKYDDDDENDHDDDNDDDDDDDDGFDDSSSDQPYADEDWYDSGRSSCDEFADWTWLEQIDGFADVGQEHVADCDVKLIRRAAMRRAFWVEMEMPSEGTSDLAFALFDRYGCLNREYYNHEFRKGSGVWGQELDHGDILLLESLRVEPLWRHQGIGTKVVNAVLDKVRTKSTGFFAFVQPGYLTRDLYREHKDEKERLKAAEEQLKVSARFWRSLGFRRVGTSGWLAFTDDSNHPSRSLGSAQDWIYPERSNDERLPEAIRIVLSSLSDASVSDADCVRQIQQTFSVEADAPPWLYSDEYDNTILHLAAVGRKPETVSYILAKHPPLTGTRNAKGYTPLEALQSSLEDRRTRRNHLARTAVLSDNFEGFSQPDIACLAALTNTEVFDLGKLSNQDISAVSSTTDDARSGRIPEISTIRHTLRLKYGCTCGQCIGGFLSPRMHYALLCQAEVRYDMLAEDMGENGSVWVVINSDDLEYLDASVRENLKTNKSMRRGFTNMCHHIAHCLKEKRVPDEETVLQLYRNQRSEWPPVTRHYLERGGTVAAVATMLFERAMNSDAWAGDGMLVENDGDEVKKLPVCRNDHEFGFVSGMCGYKRISAVRYFDSSGREL